MPDTVDFFTDTGPRSRGYVHLAAGMRDKIWVYNALQDESEIEWDGAPLATVTVLGQSGGENGPGKRTVTCLRYQSLARRPKVSTHSLATKTCLISQI